MDAKTRVLGFCKDVKETIKDTPHVRISIVKYQDALRVLKVYKNRDIKDVYQQIIDLQRKGNCEYVTKVFDVEYYSKCTFIVEEMLQGNTLEDVISYEGVLNEKTFFEVSQKLCDALVYLHSATPPIIHRDIKPQNIMMLDGGGIKLFDFDISRSSHDINSEDTTFGGTNKYCPPEQLNEGGTGTYSDVYALGVTMCRMLYDDYPKYVNKKIQLPGKSKYNNVIRKCCELNPRNRYQNAKQVKKALEKSKNKSKRIIVGGLALAVAVLVTFGVAYIMLRSDNNGQVSDNKNVVSQGLETQTTTNKSESQTQNTQSKDVLQELYDKKAWADSRPKKVEEIAGINSNLKSFIESNRLILDYSNFVKSTEKLGQVDIYGVSVVGSDPYIYSCKELDWMKFCWMSRTSGSKMGAVLFYVEPEIISSNFNRNTKLEEIEKELGEFSSQNTLTGSDRYSDFNFFEIKNGVNFYDWSYEYDEYRIKLRFYFSDNKICDYPIVIFQSK